VTLMPNIDAEALEEKKISLSQAKLGATWVRNLIQFAPNFVDFLRQIIL
jgi:hypothetical protein